MSNLEPNCKGKWEIQIKGKAESSSFEISVIREDYIHGHRSWGWFDDNKLLISHNGGPCMWPLIQTVWDKMIVLAQEVAEELNKHDQEEENFLEEQYQSEKAREEAEYLEDERRENQILDEQERSHNKREGL
jgi:hypothetical protein